MFSVLFADDTTGLAKGANLQSVISFVNLELKKIGVLFDEFLSFKPHVDMLCSKISKSLFCLNRVKNFVNSKSLRLLYFSMIHSVITYGINIYGCANKTTLEKLIVKQKQAIRTICNATYRAHTVQRLFSSSKKKINSVLQYKIHAQFSF